MLGENHGRHICVIYVFSKLQPPMPMHWLPVQNAFLKVVSQTENRRFMMEGLCGQSL